MAISFEEPNNAEFPSGDKRSLLGFTFLHFINDLHSTALPTIIPMLVSSISISLSQAGLLNALFGITNIFGQPVSGYFADRQKKPWFAVWGPMLSVTGACLLPLAPNYASAFLFVGFMSMGTALFHPQGTGRSGGAAGNTNIAFFLSLFSASGSFGSAVGPLYVVFIISLIGKPLFPLMLLPIFCICFYIWKNIAIGQNFGDIVKEVTTAKYFFNNMREILGKVGDILIISTIRDATFQGIKVFLPMLIITKGGSIQSGGFSLFAITIACTVSGIIGGKLADKVGEHKLLMSSISISPIFLLFGLYSSGALSIFMLMIGFAFLQTSTPVTTAMAQQRCPGSRSTVSSLVMGVSWGIANLFASPIGFSADMIGLQTTMHIVAYLPWTVTAWYIYKKLSADKN